MLPKSKLAEEQRTVEAEYQLQSSPQGLMRAVAKMNVKQHSVLDTQNTTSTTKLAICYSCNLFTPWGRSHDDPKKQSIT